MPRTRTQRIVFSILMAFAMVYGMELYNQALLAGGLRTELFAAPLADIVPLMATVIVLETLVGGRVAARLVGRLLDAERCPQVLVTILRGAFTCWTMCPMMSLVATLAFKQPPAGEEKEQQPQRKNSRRDEKKHKFLRSYALCLTERARDGKLDRVVGRDRETERVIQILNRRQKNNPCLIGEPGVGKTAVAEGLAQRIADGNVPYKLHDKEGLSQGGVYPPAFSFQYGPLHLHPADAYGGGF